jgi:hypothetical protein
VPHENPDYPKGSTYTSYATGETVTITIATIRAGTSQDDEECDFDSFVTSASTPDAGFTLVGNQLTWTNDGTMTPGEAEPFIWFW